MQRGELHDNISIKYFLKNVGPWWENSQDFDTVLGSGRQALASDVLTG